MPGIISRSMPKSRRSWSKFILSDGRPFGPKTDVVAGLGFVLCALADLCLKFRPCAFPLPHSSCIMVVKYQLYYFPIRGRAQAIRYLFVDNGIEYDETDIKDGWVSKYKPMMPFGQVPVVQDGDLQVAQSNSILRYLGRKHGLYPSDPVEALKVDMVTDHSEDIRIPYVRMIYTNYENGKDDFVKTLPEKFGYLENLFKKWGTEFISSKISFADYNMLDLLDDMMVLSPTCLEGFPTLKAYYERMVSRPAIKKHRETEQFKNMPVNGNGKQ